MYDLDFSSPEAVKKYQIFHKALVRRGWIMLQYSVYMKMVHTAQQGLNSIQQLKQFLPPNGNIRIIKITNQQYMQMTLMRGNKNINESLNTEERYIKIEAEEHG